MKKILALILALLMMTIFVGCGDSSEDVVNESEVTEEEVQEGEEIEITIDAFYSADDEMMSLEYLSSDMPESMQSIGTYTSTKGATVGECFEESGYTDITVVDEDGKFLGFMEYKINKTTDENGEETWQYEKVSDELLTTEEMLESQVNYNVMFLAKWEGVSDETYDNYYS